MVEKRRAAAEPEPFERPDAVICFERGQRRGDGRVADAELLQERVSVAVRAVRRVGFSAERQEHEVSVQCPFTGLVRDREPGGDGPHSEVGRDRDAEPLHLFEQDVPHGRGVHAERVDAAFLFEGQKAQTVEEVEAVLGLEGVQNGVDEGGIAVVPADGDVRVREVAAAVAGGQDLAARLGQLLDEHDVHRRAFPLEGDGGGKSRRARTDDECTQADSSLNLMVSKKLRPAGRQPNPLCEGPQPSVRPFCFSTD